MNDHSSSTYISNVATDTERLLRDADAEVSALTGGAADQTVSDRAAVADHKRRWWAEAFCGFLSVTVQPHHCEVTLAGAPVLWWVYPRALVCFLFFLIGVPWFAVTLRAGVAYWWGAAMLLNAAVGVAMLMKEKP